MPRIKRGVTAKRRHKKIIAMASGYRGRTNCFRIAIQKVHKGLQYAYRDRRRRKRDFRALWIQRINAAARQMGSNYSIVMSSIRTAGFDINRKMLSEIAIHNHSHFESIVQSAKEAISKE